MVPIIKQSLAPESKPTDTTPPDIATASVPDTLARFHVNPDTGLTNDEVDVRRKEVGYNEVAEKKGHPILIFLGKFWGLSAWMLELIMVLSVRRSWLNGVCWSAHIRWPAVNHASLLRTF